MLEIVQDLVVTRDEAAQGAERLGEGAHDQVHLVGQAEVVCRAAAVVAHHAEAVCVVDHQRGIVSFTELHELRDGRNVAFHGIDAVHDDEFRFFQGHHLHLLLQPLHVVVGELQHVAVGEPAAVDDAGVVEGVEEDVAAVESQAGNHAQVDLEARAVGHGLLLAHQAGQLLLQRQVDVERPVEETGTGAAGAVFADGLDGRFLETGVVGESQVGVRAEHQDVLAGHPDDRVLPRFDGTVIWIDTHGLHLVRQGIFRTDLVQQAFFHL